MATVDRSDRKSLNNLMDTLLNLQKSASKIQKTASPKRARSKSTRKRLVSNVSNTSTHKITQWFNKENTTKQSKRPQLPVTITKQEKKKTLTKHPSFEKYGLALPSFEKIVAEQKEYDRYKDQVKMLEALDDLNLEQSPPKDCLVDKQHSSLLKLDCKHLTVKQLTKAFKTHKSTLHDIFAGEIYNKRHQLYQKNNSISQRDLKCSSSCMVFNQDQIDFLLDLMKLEFDNEGTKTMYFFQVLLPELCLLIFMDVYEMNKRKAASYLDKRPLDV